MNATQVDARVIANALHIDTMDLARLLTGWAKDAMPNVEFDRNWEPLALEDFDDRVATARTYLVEAHAAMQAWNTDNPPDTEEEAA